MASLEAYTDVCDYSRLAARAALAIHEDCTTLSGELKRKANVQLKKALKYQRIIEHAYKSKGFSISEDEEEEMDIVITDSGMQP